MVPMCHASTIEILKDRSKMLQRARSFFLKRGLYEVDCPILSAHASIDSHIDLISAQYLNKQNLYLHSSPEYGMKRLLSQGSGDIFQISHVFRDGEVGQRHNPEFMLAEWYRLGFSLEKMMEETAAFVELFVGRHDRSFLSYRQALESFVGIDYVQSCLADLWKICHEKGLVDKTLDRSLGKDDLLSLIFSLLVEPQLDPKKITIVFDYPSSQCALAKVRREDGVLVAKRFEIYFRNMELANGYEELIDAKEQRQRLVHAQRLRLEMGKKKTLPLDENFLAGLKSGLPECCGVAVGFDRLMMLRHKKTILSQVLPFSWEKS